MIKLSSPKQQINFAFTLMEIRRRMLADALNLCIEKADIHQVDAQLHTYVSSDDLKKLAKSSLRGEVLFAVPCILEICPYLLGYYRLLLGYSQKEFYTSETGIGKFKTMEERNYLSVQNRERLAELCQEINKSASILLDGLAENMIRKDFLDDLTLLTLGPQLRGGANVQRGTDSILQVFNVISRIVHRDAVQVSNRRFDIINSSGRRVLIEFASDPDIVIREEIKKGIYRCLIAVEVKGGQDYSNIHNRIGEAEKSHQKARKYGYTECWTVVNVDKLDMGMAQRESPSTDRFYKISDLINESSDGYEDFRARIISSIGIK